MKSLRKIISFFLVLIMVFSTFINVNSNSNIQLVVDGKPVVFTDAYPFVENGRTLVPVRALAEAMEATVDWNGETNTVALTKGEFSLSLKIGAYKTAFGNGKETITKDMDTKAIVINGRTYIPARFVGYGLGYSVEWKDPVVYYTFINKQTTDFKVDTSVKYPNKYQHYNRTFSYYDGYGDVKIVNGDDGDVIPMKNADGSIMKNVYGEIVYKFDGNAFSYNQTPHNMIFDSERFNIDLDNKSPEENLENFKEVFEDISMEKFEKEQSPNIQESLIYRLSYNTSKDIVIMGYSPNGKIFGLEKYNKYKWTIVNTCIMTDFSMYLHQSETGGYIKGMKNDSTIYRGGDKNTLMLLNSFLGEDGQKIWQMLHDYYNNSGKQYVAPNTYWPYPENKKPPLNKEIVEMYDLKFVEFETDEMQFQYTTIYCPTINRTIAIKMDPIGPSHALNDYTILF